MTEKFLINKLWTNGKLFFWKKKKYLHNHFSSLIETFEEALKILSQDLPLSPNAPGGMVEYRKSLTSSFFFKFFVYVQNQLETVPYADLSGFLLLILFIFI